MNYRFKAMLTSTVSVAAIAMSWAGTASAQGTQQSQGVAGLEEITVTARRVEENVQRVPVAVTALSPETLAERGIVDVGMLQTVVPAFNKASNDRGGFAWLRGLEGIASYFADAPFSIASFGQNFDVGTFQVLMGPQGTLFGQSSAAGAIVVNPVRPGESFGGYMTATMGSYALRNLQGAMNMPLFDGKVLTRIAVDNYYRRGYVRNIDVGKDYGDENSFTIRPSVTWKITEDLENYTMLSYYHSRNNGKPNYVINYDPTGVWANAVRRLNRNGDTPDDVVGRILNKSPGLGKYVLKNIDEAQGFSGEKDNVLYVVNETNWDVVDNVSLKNIFAYTDAGSRVRLDSSGDGNFNAANFSQAVAESQTGLRHTKTWSDEFKVQSQWWEDRIDVGLGTFHTATVHPHNYAFGFGGLVPSLNVTRGATRSPVRSRAVYANGSVDLSDVVLDGLKVNLGYRRTWDKTKQSRWQLRTNLATPYQTWAVVPPAGTTVPGPPTLEQEAHFKYDNWLVGLTYQYTPDTMFYLTTAKGVTNGQVNLNSPVGFRITQPETLTQIEGGFKSTFDVGDIKVRTNVSAYHGWYKDIQVTVVRQAQVNLPPAPMTAIAISENAAEGRVRGVDYELTVVPTDWLELTTTGAWNANKYTAWPSTDAAGNPLDRSDSRFLGNPKMKYTLGAKVYLPIPEEWGQLSVRADWQHQSRAWFDGSQVRANQVPFVEHTIANGYGPNYATGEKVGADSVNPHGTLDLGMTWNELAGISGLSSTATVTNVTKQKEIIVANYVWHAQGYISGFARPPRMFTVGLNYKF